jgi:hypothetical protein
MRVRWRPFVLVAVVGLAVGAGLAWAAIPDSSGVIHACYKQTGGNLRVIDPGAGGSCHAGEQSLSWPGAEHVVLRSTTHSIPHGTADTFSVLCHEGERATGGGYRLFPGFTTPELLPLMTAQGSVPIESGAGEPEDGDSPDGWKVIAALNRDDDPQDATVFVVCESP